MCLKLRQAKGNLNTILKLKPITNASAATLVPRTTPPPWSATTIAERSAPATPATTAKVVTARSIPPSLSLAEPFR